MSRIYREQDRIPDTKNPGTRWIREIESWNHILKNVNLQNASKEDSDLGTTLVPRDRGLRSHTQECPVKTQLQQRGLRIAYPFPRIVRYPRDKQYLQPPTQECGIQIRNKEGLRIAKNAHFPRTRE